MTAIKETTYQPAPRATSPGPTEAVADQSHNTQQGQVSIQHSGKPRAKALLRLASQIVTRPWRGHIRTGCACSASLFATVYPLELRDLSITTHHPVSQGRAISSHTGRAVSSLELRDLSITTHHPVSQGRAESPDIGRIVPDINHSKEPEMPKIFDIPPLPPIPLEPLTKQEKQHIAELIRTIRKDDLWRIEAQKFIQQCYIRMWLSICHDKKTPPPLAASRSSTKYSQIVHRFLSTAERFRLHTRPQLAEWHAPQIATIASNVWRQAKTAEPLARAQSIANDSRETAEQQEQAYKPAYIIALEKGAEQQAQANKPANIIAPEGGTE